MALKMNFFYDQTAILLIALAMNGRPKFYFMSDSLGFQ